MSILVEIFKDLISQRYKHQPSHDADVADKPKENCVLNVGGGSKATAIPSHYSGWRHDLLDIDPRGEPDIVCDARTLTSLGGAQYDAIYCSHNLEHYYRHEGLKVIQGFVHMLKQTGFAEVRVPDLQQVIHAVTDIKMDLDDVLYDSAAGPITAHDVIYGLQTEIVASGEDFYAHKTGFTPRSLTKLLLKGGFKNIYLIDDEYLAVHAFAFKTDPTDVQMRELNLDLSFAPNSPHIAEARL